MALAGAAVFVVRNRSKIDSKAVGIIMKKVSKGILIGT